MAIFSLELIPITPLHIGSGEDLPGYEYLLDDDEHWYVYSIDQALGALPPLARQGVVDVALRNVMRLPEALTDYRATLRQVAYHIGGYSSDAHRKWAEASEKGNQAEAQRFIHSQHRIYIPGSSLKGALRTALFYGYLEPLPTNREGRDTGWMQADTFDYEERLINTDPFRFFKVSDSDVLRDATDLRLLQRHTYRTEEHQWRNDDALSLLAECTPSVLSQVRSDAQTITLHSRLTISEDAYTAATKSGTEPWHFGVQALLEACTHFWQQNLEAERNYTAGMSAVAGAYQALADYAAELPAHATLIRLGFGTGHDSKTINYAQPDPLVHHSRLLVDGVWPLGWAEMRVLTAEGKPFTAADDLPWTVTPIRRQPRRTSKAEAARAKELAGAQAAAKAARAAEEKAQQRQSAFAGDIMAFLRRKNESDEQ